MQILTMPQAALLTAEEFEEFSPPDDYRYELVRGRIVRMSPPGPLHGGVGAALTSLLHQHVRRHKLGFVSIECGCILERNPDTVRGPDIAFIRRDRVPDGLPIKFFQGPPDLAVEVISFGDRRGEIQDKVDEYLAVGVLVVLTVHPVKRTVTVFRRLIPPVTLGVDDELDLDDVRATIIIAAH